MPRTINPVSSFGEELHRALREGCQREYRITFDDPILAKRFMHRINHLRAALRKESHQDWQALYRCGVHIDHHDPRCLILAPRDSEFRSALRNAQVRDAPEPLPITEYQVPTPLPDSAVESFLGELTSITQIPPKEPGEGENSC